MMNKNIIVCINSDDPAVLIQMCQMSWHIFIMECWKKGISREAALLWIDRVRRNGLNSSFIHHEESDLALVRNLTELIE